MEDITIKLPADDPFSHPTMGKTHAPLFSSVDFPKNVLFWDEFVDLTDVDHILMSEDSGFIRYKDGREIRFNKERVCKLGFLLAYLHAMDYPQPSKRARKFRFNPFWLVWFLATLAMVYFISGREPPWTPTTSSSSALSASPASSASSASSARP